MKKIHVGLLFGVIAGLIDITPMIWQKLNWDANLSAFSLWMVAGFFISTSELKLPGALKGLLIAFLVLLPSAILIASLQPLSLIPITIMTLILGSSLGFAIKRFGGIYLSNKKHFSLEEAKKIGEKIGIKWDKFDVDQFRRGMDVELEHGQIDPTTNVTNDDPLITGKIALAHLNEFPDYYDRLAKMEEEAEKFFGG